MDPHDLPDPRLERIAANDLATWQANRATALERLEQHPFPRAAAHGRLTDEAYWQAVDDTLRLHAQESTTAAQEVHSESKAAWRLWRCVRGSWCVVAEFGGAALAIFGPLAVVVGLAWAAAFWMGVWR